MGDPGSFAAVVDRVLAGEAPRQVRAAAARGALPLPRATLVRLYLVLRTDEEDEIRADAEASLAALGTGDVLEVLEDVDCAPEVIDHFAPQAARDDALAERVAFHKAAPASALATLARQGGASVIDLVLTNQERLLTHPELLDRLTANPALRADQRGRILELLARAARVLDAAADPEVETDGEEASVDFEEAARLLEVDVGELFAASEIIDGEEFEQAEDPGLRSAYRRILTLNTAQKAILAMRGGREERMILIRDTNKLVAVAALRNPRITEEDVESISRMRNVSNEVLRQIGQSRDWLKSYPVVTALVNNPKTPPGVSTNLIGRLRNHELKRIVTNHDVPELIRRMSKRTLELRTRKRT